MRKFEGQECGKHSIDLGLSNIYAGKRGQAATEALKGKQLGAFTCS